MWSRAGLLILELPYGSLHLIKSFISFSGLDWMWLMSSVMEKPIINLTSQTSIFSVHLLN